MQIHPRGDRVLVKVAEEETKTRGGILLPTSAVKKPTSGMACISMVAEQSLVSWTHVNSIESPAGDVLELGDGRTGNETRSFTLKKGDTVSVHSSSYTEGQYAICQKAPRAEGHHGVVSVTWAPVSLP